MKLKVNISRGFLLMLALGLFSLAQAQTTVSGVVTDAETGETLIGANILVVGTSTGTVTDFDGNYTLTVPEGATQLEFSYTGYGSQIIDINGRTTIDVALGAGQLLDEVVVIGYGQIRKEDQTGAVSSLSTEDFNQGVINSPEQLLQGRVAGVRVTQSSGEPGAGINVQIRGQGSIRAGDGPLYVIDGVPIDGGNISPGGADAGGLGSSSARNPLTFLNPNDIARMDILKDASATAIYGSRGANGVVLITTKKGATGEGTLTYDMQVGFSNPANQLDIMDAQEYRRLAVPLGAQDFGSSTDFQDLIFRTGFQQQHSAAFAGGTDQTNYRVSLSMLDQTGIVENSGIDRYTGRLNANHKAINDRLTLSLQLTAAKIMNQYTQVTDNAGFQGDLLGAALIANPTRPIVDADGNFIQSQDFRNPAAILEFVDDRDEISKILGSFSAEFEIIDGLSYKMNLGVEESQTIRQTSYDNRLQFITNGQGRAESVQNNSQLIEHTLNYRRAFGNLNLTALGGYSYQRFYGFGFSAGARDFQPSDIPQSENLQAGDPNIRQVGSGGGVYELQSYFGRAILNLDNKYTLTASLRADGSSRFGPNNKYGYFPSFALAWRLGEEQFIQDMGLFDDLKLRLGYGITGNQALPDNYAYLQRYTVDNTGALGLFQVENPDLQWEETSQFNIGLDFGFSAGRFTGTIDYFSRTTTDLIFGQAPIAPAPGSVIFSNLDADIINQGVELGLSAVIVDNANFSWSTDLNFTAISNRVENLPFSRLQTGAVRGQGLSGVTIQVVTDNEPQNAFFGPTFLGFNNDGDPLFDSVEGDPVTSATDPNARLGIIGSPFPNFTAGWNNNFTYSNFDLSFFFNVVQGNDVYNNTSNAFFTRAAINNSRNTTVANANSPERLDAGLAASSRFLEDGSFIRLQNATLGYNFDINSSWLNTLRLFVTGQNLFIITDYSGFDPEVNTSAGANGIPSFGLDYTTYPRPRTLLFGLKARF